MTIWIVILVLLPLVNALCINDTLVITQSKKIADLDLEINTTDYYVCKYGCDESGNYCVQPTSMNIGSFFLLLILFLFLIFFSNNKILSILGSLGLIVLSIFAYQGISYPSNFYFKTWIIIKDNLLLNLLYLIFISISIFMIAKNIFDMRK